MMVMFFCFVVAVVVVLVLIFLFCLHSFFYFFGLYLVAKSFEKIDNLHVFVLCVLKGIFYPGIAFTANINENVCS